VLLESLAFVEALVHNFVMADRDRYSTPAERFMAVLELHDFAIRQMRANLRRRWPNAETEEIERRLAEWSMERPGAEHGDGIGVPVEPAQRFG
jgi:hypothetical protein